MSADESLLARMNAGAERLRKWAQDVNGMSRAARFTLLGVGAAVAAAGAVLASGVTAGVAIGAGAVSAIGSAASLIATRKIDSAIEQNRLLETRLQGEKAAKGLTVETLRLEIEEAELRTKLALRKAEEAQAETQRAVAETAAADARRTLAEGMAKETQATTKVLEAEHERAIVQTRLEAVEGESGIDKARSNSRRPRRSRWFGLKQRD